MGDCATSDVRFRGSLRKSAKRLIIPSQLCLKDGRPHPVPWLAASSESEHCDAVKFGMVDFNPFEGGLWMD